MKSVMFAAVLLLANSCLAGMVDENYFKYCMMEKGSPALCECLTRHMEEDFTEREVADMWQNMDYDNYQSKLDKFTQQTVECFKMEENNDKNY